MFNSILIVCVGNICRSPAVEKMLRHALPSDISVTSAGLGALVGHPIDEQMQVLLVKEGVDPAGHSARQLDQKIALEADLILTMEREHVAAISGQFPEVAGKTMLVGKWNGNEEIADPYRRSDEFFALVYEQMKSNVEMWASKLN